jgi:hypothetical protein
MKIRKYLSDQPFEEYASDDCAWCEAGRRVKWQDGGVIFFENDRGELRRVEGFPSLRALMPFGGLPMICREVSTLEANAEIAALDHDSAACSGPPTCFELRAAAGAALPLCPSCDAVAPLLDVALAFANPALYAFRKTQEILDQRASQAREDQRTGRGRKARRSK